MDLTRAITGWVQRKYKPISVCEAEIREELEFHLEMRSLDNEAAGMTVQEARQDAQSRFGNFEKQYEACRQVTLGWQLALRRLQILFVIGLALAVVCLAWTLVQAQSIHTEYQTQLDALRAQLQASQQSTGHTLNRIPVVQWKPSESLNPSLNVSITDSRMEFVPKTLDEPWSHWGALSETVLPVSESP